MQRLNQGMGGTSFLCVKMLRYILAFTIKIPPEIVDCGIIHQYPDIEIESFPTKVFNFDFVSCRDSKSFVPFECNPCEFLFDLHSSQFLPAKLLAQWHL